MKHSHFKLLDTLNADHYRTLKRGATNSSNIDSSSNKVLFAIKLIGSSDFYSEKQTVHSAREVDRTRIEDMENRNRANPFSISSLLDKKVDRKREGEDIDVEGSSKHKRSEDESTKDESARERVPGVLRENKHHRLSPWFSEYQPRQSSIEASK